MNISSSFFTHCTALHARILALYQMEIQNVFVDCKFTMEILSKTDADIQNFPFFSVDLLLISAFGLIHTNTALCW